VKRLDALSVGKPVNAANTFPVESCSVCASPLHQAQNCPSMTVFDRTKFGYSQENEPLGRIALRKYRDRTTENGVL
jgi:hypothetical protein